MKTLKNLIRLFSFCLIIAGVSTACKTNVKAAQDIASPQAPHNIRAYKHTTTSVRLKWKAGAGADGYILYRYAPSSKSYIKVRTVKHASGKKEWLSWIDEGLQTNKVYRYKIAAYKGEGADRQVSGLSDWVSAKTYKKYSKKVNARAPKTGRKKVTLGLCSAEKVKCRVVPSKFGKNKKRKAFSQKVRWRSTDPSVAKVDQKGRITAGAKPGSCLVYATAHNGARTKIKVTVKNFARAKEYYNYEEDPDISTLLTDYKAQIQDIAEYYSIHRPRKGEVFEFALNKDAKMVATPANADMGNLKEELEALLVDFPYFIEIRVDAFMVEFALWEEDPDTTDALVGYVRFYFNQTWDEWNSQIASHWEAYRFRPV